MNDAAQVDGTKKQDGSPEAAAVMSITDIAEKVKNVDDRDVRKLIDQDPNLANRLLAMSDAELDDLEKQLSPGTPPAMSQPGQEQPPAPATDKQAAAPEEELVIKLKPSDLGTYLSKGRSGQDAVIELVKGKRSADDRLKFLKEDQIPALERTAQGYAKRVTELEKEIETLRKKPAAEAAAPAEAAPKKAEPVPVDVPEEIDFYDPESQKKIVETLRAFQQNAAALRAEIDALKKAPAAPATATPEPKPEAPQGPDHRVLAEFDAIRLMQRDPESEGHFATKNDVAEAEKQYLNFIMNIGRQNGIAKVFDANGRFTPEIGRVLDVYFDPASPDHQRITAAATAAGITLPEDYPTLMRIYQVREIRNRYQAQDPITGVYGPIPYIEAIRLARTMKPEIFTSSKTGPQAQREAIASAKEARSAFAPEPAGATSSDADLQQHETPEEYYRLMKKSRDEYTPEEVSRLSSMLKKYAEFSDREVEEYFKKPGG